MFVGFFYAAGLHMIMSIYFLLTSREVVFVSTLSGGGSRNSFSKSSHLAKVTQLASSVFYSFSLGILPYKTYTEVSISNGSLYFPSCSNKRASSFIKE